VPANWTLKGVFTTVPASGPVVSFSGCGAILMVTGVKAVFPAESATCRVKLNEPMAGECR